MILWLSHAGATHWSVSVTKFAAFDWSPCCLVLQDPLVLLDSLVLLDIWTLTIVLVRKTQLATTRGIASDPTSQLKEMTIETPPTPAYDKRESERLMKQAATQGRATYNDMTGTGERKRKRRSRHGSKSTDQAKETSAGGGNATSRDKAPQRTSSLENHHAVMHRYLNLQECYSRLIIRF
jgi:hypothetical protein